MEPSTKPVISTQPTPAPFDFLTSVGQQMASMSLNQTRPTVPLTQMFRYETTKEVVRPLFPEERVVTVKSNESFEKEKPKSEVHPHILLPQSVIHKQETPGPKINVANGSVSSSGEKTKNGELTTLQREVECLRIENRAQKEQLKLQSQVNSDLKKLLVASVGEDIEARVHFLTEDKVKLANDIRRYVEQLSVDFETKETLSVQADLWRSKYLAANVLVDETRQWKSALARRCDQLQNCIRLLVDEHNKTRKMSLDAYRRLVTLQKAFITKENLQGTAKSSNVISVMAENVAALDVLQQRLLGNAVSTKDGTELEDLCPNTNGERLALNLLIAELHTQLERLDGATSVLTGDTVSLADNKMEPLKCCIACSKARDHV